MGIHSKHDLVLDKALMQLGSSDRALLLHTVYRVWADYIAEENEARKQAQFEDYLMETHGKHTHVLEMALTQWATGDAIVLLLTAVRCWADYRAELVQGKHLGVLA